MDDKTANLTEGLSGCDERAWREFHERFYQTLYNLAVARGVSACNAAAIVQGVYLRVLRHAKVFRDPDGFNAWLACLVRCEVIDAARGNGRRNWMNERFQQWQQARLVDGESAAGERLEEAMLELEETDRSLIRHHYFDGWSQESLAELHQVSVKAVESKLARIRKRLRQNLGKTATDPST